MIQRVLFATTIVIGIAAMRPLHAMQQDSSEARIIIVVDSLDRAAFVNVAELLQARVPGLHISRTGDGGMRWFIRGPASLWGSAPLVLFDDVRRNMASPSMREFGTRPPPLDEIDIEDVERIEISAGPATTARYGTDAGHGVIRIVSFAPRQREMSLRITAAAGVANEAASYPANYARRGLDSAGNSVRYCTLRLQANGGCTPVEPPISRSVLESHSPFESAMVARAAAALGSGNERLAWRAGGSFEREGTTTGTLASQRFHARSAAAVRDGERAELLIRAHWMRGEGDLPSVNEPSVRSQGLFARPDTVWPGFVPPHSPQYVSMRYGATAVGRWRPRDWLGARLTSGIERQRDEDDLELTRPLGGGLGNLRVEAEGKRRQRELTVRLEVEARYGTSTPRHATALTVEHARSRQEYEFHEFSGTDGSYFERMFWVHRPSQITGIGLMQRLSLGQRVALAGGLRLDRVTLHDVRWDAPLFRHLSLSWDVRRFTSTPVGGVRLRAALGETANLPQATDVFLPVGSMPPEQPKAETTREQELGMDIEGARNRVSLSLTWYNKRTRDVADVFETPFRGVARIQVLNRGIEGSLRARIVQTPRVSWDARATYAYNRNKVKRSEASHPIELDESGIFSRQFVQDGEPLAAHLTFPIVSIRDRDGDGLINGYCFEDFSACEVVASRNREFRPAFPPTSASLETSVRIGAATFTALLDHQSGHFLYNQSLAARCLYISVGCQAAYDPATPLADQAEAILAGEPAAFVEDATHTKLREISLRFAAPATWAQALGSSRLHVAFAGRNLATWSDYRGADVESTSLPWIPLASVDNAAAPLPRRFVIRVDMYTR